MVTYTKLRDGSWGLRSTAAVKAGDRVTAAKKDGSTKAETVGRVVWSGDGVWLCSIAGGGVPRPSGAAQRGGRRGGTRTGCSCGSVEEYSKPTDCWTCRHDAE